MKDKIFIAIFCMVTLWGQAQIMQNTKWTFGIFTGLNFIPDPYNPSPLDNVQLGSIESCASISDAQGNLLFYTDGSTVWMGNHQVMANGTGLLGNVSNTQGAVIVPKPKSNIYYIISIDGQSGTRQGLHFSEVDMTNSPGFVIAATKNTPLRDHNGTPIHGDTYGIINYGSTSEKLTSTFHSNGRDYWLITQIENHIYSYRISSAGISLTPTSVTLSPVTLSVQQGSAGQMKISADGSKIGIAYASNSSTWSGFVALGTFNNTTGAVTLSNDPITIPGETSYYGLEFSPSGQYVYFTTNSVYHSTSKKTGGNKLFIAGTENSEVSGKASSIKVVDSFAKTSDPVSGQGTSPYYGSLQLAINGRIYLSNGDIGIKKFLSVINEPENYSNPNLQTYSVSVNNNVSGSTIKYSLPQWVHWQEAECQYAVTLNYPELHFFPYSYKYDAHITTTGTYYINSGKEINMFAGEDVVMQDGTFIKEGSLYLARIQQCVATSTSREAAGEIEENSLLNSNDKIDLAKFSVTPNPTTGQLHLSGEPASSIKVYDLSGKVVFELENFGGEAVIDLSAIESGIYIVRAISEHETKIVKIIKN